MDSQLSGQSARPEASALNNAACADMLEKVLRKKKTSSWKVVEMQLFLIARGEEQKGKKAELVNR